MKFNSLVDCHVHCTYSDDCSEQASNVVDVAIKKNLHGLIFTDHYDIDYPNNKYKFEFNVKERFDYLTTLARDNQDRMYVGIGIEVGIQPQVLSESAELVKKGNFDLVLCSIHAVDGFALCSQKEFYEGKTKEQVYRRYLEEIYFGVCNFLDYDVVSHIGYVRRYGHYSNSTLAYKDYSDIIDMILKKIIDDGRGIEINTSGYLYNLGSTIPEIDLIMRYKQLGGQILTLGSDAHRAENVGNEFAIAVDIAQRSGFKYLSYFKNRTPIFVPI